MRPRSGVRRAAGHGFVIAMLTIASARGAPPKVGAATQGDFAKELAAAKKGGVAAMIEVAGGYVDGRGVTKDANKGVIWLKRAARVGNVVAMRRLGDVYSDDGIAIENIDVASAWYGKAIKHGNAATMDDLGMIYSSGRGVAKKYSLAIEWFRKAAKIGNADAINNVGWLSAYGQSETRFAQAGILATGDR